MDVLENSDFFGESRISWTFWTRKLGFCSLQAQRVDDQTGYTRRPKSASDSIFRCPGTPDFRPVFGHFGHFSAPAAPLELKTGLSISISAPLSVSEHQMAQKWPKNGQTGGSKKWKKQKNENWKKQKLKNKQENEKQNEKSKSKRQEKKTRKSKTRFSMFLSRGGRCFSLSPAGLSRLARNGAPPAPRRPSWVAAQGGCLVGRAAALVVASPVGRGTRLRGPVRK